MFKNSKQENYPVLKAGDLPKQAAEALWRYIDKYGNPVYPIEIKVDGEVIIIDLFSMKETA